MSTLESLFKNKRWAMIFRKIDNLFQNIKARPSRLLGVVGLSLVSTFCIVMCYFYLARSMELELEIRTLSIVVPLSFFAASLPISVGGLGVRESAVIFLLSLFNVGTNQGVELNILYLLTLILVTAPGAIFLFCTPLSKRAKTTKTIEKSQGN